MKALRHKERPALERVALRMPWPADLGLRALRLLPTGSRPRMRMLWWITRRAVAAVNRGDLDAALAIAYEPDVRIRPIGFAPDTAELYLGYEGMHDFFAHWTEAMGWPNFTVGKITDLGSRLLLDVAFVSAGRISGAETVRRSGFVLTISPRGRLAEWDMYWERDEAYAAVGLPG